uniref:Si:dkeyp-97e7.9 n=1 Tax=Gadus morhua TaxID=8049 RepID=A0A8C5F9K5_GADMO
MDHVSSNRRKTMVRLHKAEVMIAGEQLRLRLHDCKLVKERRYHLRTYPNCFVAQELTDWLVVHKEAPDRATAICLMQHLMDHDIVHHVCDKRPVFKDAKLLYRFRKDDGTFPFNKEVKVFMLGQRLYEHLIVAKDSVLQQREKHGVIYQRCFPGCHLIDWLLQNAEVESRKQGVELCRALQEHGIFQHVLKKHNFFDSGLLYQFSINFRRRRRLSELLHDNEQDNEEGPSVPTLEDVQPDSPFVLHKTPQEDYTGFNSGKIKDFASVSQLHIFPAYILQTLMLIIKWFLFVFLVLRRNLTCEELLSPGAPFSKRVLTVIGDALGWGFVVRGMAPCYVQAVDPGSPAAAGGVKVVLLYYFTPCH